MRLGIPADRVAVFVSLPRNDPDLAAAAAEAGADGLKVHINTDHRASGTVFAGLKEEKRALDGILEVGLPTGLVAGGPGGVDLGEVREAATMGFAYVDVYAEAAPAGYVAACHPAMPVAALGPRDDAAVARELVAAGVAGLELSTLDPSLYGTPLSLSTTARVRAVRASVGPAVPLIFPSQHRISPSDLALLSASGASAVLLGAVVFGADPMSLRRAVQLFVEAAQDG